MSADQQFGDDESGYESYDIRAEQHAAHEPTASALLRPCVRQHGHGQRTPFAAALDSTRRRHPVGLS
jgi:hypothetical protein